MQTDSQTTGQKVRADLQKRMGPAKPDGWAHIQAFDMKTGAPVKMTDPRTHTAEQAVADFKERAAAQGLVVGVKLLPCESGIHVELDYGGATGKTDAVYADVMDLENAFSEVLDENYG